MVKCYYCDYEYEILSDFHKHLNDKHTKCMNCGKVIDNRQDNYALCSKCEKGNIHKHLENK